MSHVLIVDDERSKIQAFDAGADGYVTKPFGLAELRLPSVPTVGVTGEVGGLWRHDAEDVAGRISHHPPRADLLDPGRSEFLQANHLGRDVVGLDVEMETWFTVADPLHEQIETVRPPHLDVGAVLVGLPGATEGAGPEPGRCIEGDRCGVDPECRET